MENKTLYEADVPDLTLKGRNRRIFRAANILVFELALLVILTFFFGIFAIIFYFIALLIFLPHPLLTSPSKYKIITRGVVYRENRLIPLKKEYKLQINTKGEFVSVLHHRKGEFLRLYTHEPEQVHKILNSLISSQKE